MSEIKSLPAFSALSSFKENHPELSSVEDIVRFPEARFVADFGDELGGTRNARKVYQEAQRLQEQLVLLWANIKDAVASPAIRTALFNNIPDSFLEHQRSIPSFQRLFGNLDILECDHCRSIFGPAAYFVDLLRFVETHIMRQNAVPRGHSLDERQPQLRHLALDCDNTYTLIPTIDLINEVLEDLVRTGPDTPYQIAAKALFPQSLPFHLPLAEMRLFLEQLKLKLQTIYRLFGIVEPAIAQEILALSPQEYDLIRTPLTPDTLDRVYGGSPQPIVTLTPDEAEATSIRDDLSQLRLPDAVQASLGEAGLTFSSRFAVQSRPTDANRWVIDDILNRRQFTVIWDDPDIKVYQQLPNRGEGSLEDITVFTAQTGLSPVELDPLLFLNLSPAEVEAGLSRQFFINNTGEAAEHLQIKTEDTRRVLPDPIDVSQDDIGALNTHQLPESVRSPLIQQLGGDVYVLVDAADEAWRIWSVQENVTYRLERFHEPSQSSSSQSSSDIKLQVLEDPYDRLENLTPSRLDRIYRFLKLARLLDWSFVDLDWALRSLQGTLGGETVLRFDGINDFIEIPNLEGLPNEAPPNAQVLESESLTIEAWVMPSQRGTQPILAKGSPDAVKPDEQTHYLFWITSDGRLALYSYLQTEADPKAVRSPDHRVKPLTDDDWNMIRTQYPVAARGNRVPSAANAESVNTGINLTGERSLPIGIFSHVAVTIDNSKSSEPDKTIHSQVKFYINGVLDSTWSLDIAIPLTTTDTKRPLYMTIGKNLHRDVFCGSISEVRLWKTVRTAEHIAALRFQRCTGRETDLLAYWPLLESQDLRVREYVSGNGTGLSPLDGLLGGTSHHAIPQWVTGDLAIAPFLAAPSIYAYHFNGVDDYVGGSVHDLNPSLLTIEARVKISGDGPHPILTKGNATTDDVQFRLYLDGQYRIGFTSAALDQPIAPSDMEVPDPLLTDWVHIAVVVSPTAINVYRDGSTVFTRSLNTPLELSEYGTDLYLGRDFSNTYLNGALQEVRLWNVARSAEELDTARHHQLVGTEPGLIGYWRLDEPHPEQGVAQDRSPQQNHLFPGGILSRYQPIPESIDPILPQPVAETAHALRFDSQTPFYPLVLENLKHHGLGYPEQVSLQFWWRATRPSEGRQILFSQGDEDTGLCFYLLNGALYGYAWCAAFGGDPIKASVTFTHESPGEALKANTWYQLTFICDETVRNGIVYHLFLNGQSLPYAVSANGESVTEDDKIAKGFRLDQVGRAYLAGMRSGGFTRFHDEVTAQPDDTQAVQYLFSGNIVDFALWHTDISEPDPADPKKRRVAVRHVPPQPSEDLVAYFPLDDDYGRSINDHTGLKYATQTNELKPVIPDQSPARFHGELYVGPDPVPPKWAIASNLPLYPTTALYLNGASQYLRLPDTDTLNLLRHDFTIETWIRIPEFNAVPILGSGNPGNIEPSQRFVVEVTETGRLQVRQGSQTVTSTTSLSVNAWTHIAVRCQAGQFTLFINGKVASDPQELGTIQANYSLYLGRHDDSHEDNEGHESSDRYFKGYVSHLRVWRVARTQEQIHTTWNTTISEADPALTALWTLEASPLQWIYDRTRQYAAYLVERGDRTLSEAWETLDTVPAYQRQAPALNLNPSLTQAGVTPNSFESPDPTTGDSPLTQTPDFIDLETVTLPIEGTVELWVQFDPRANSPHVLFDASIMVEDASVTNETATKVLPFMIRLTPDSTLEFLVIDDATAAVVNLTELGDADPFAENRHHIAATWSLNVDTKELAIALHVDEIYHTHRVTVDGIWPQWATPYIGVSRTATQMDNADAYLGQISAVRIWSHGRSLDDLYRLRHADLDGTEPGLLAYLPLDEGSDKIRLKELSTSQEVWLRTLTVPHPNPQWIIADAALQFDGQQNFIEIPDYAPPQAGTIELWMKCSLDKQIILDASNDISEQATNKERRFFYLEMNQARQLQFRLEDDNEVNFGVSSGQLPREFAQTWHHIAITWEYSSEPLPDESQPGQGRANNQGRGNAQGQLGGVPGRLVTASLYIDGKEETLKEFEIRKSQGGRPDFRSLYIGINRGIYSIPRNDPFTGQIRKVRAWDRRLSATELQSLRDVTFRGNEPHLRVELPLNEGTGTTLINQASDVPVAFRNLIAVRPEANIENEAVPVENPEESWLILDHATVLQQQVPNGEEFFIAVDHYTPSLKEAGAIAIWAQFDRQRDQVILDASGRTPGTYFRVEVIGSQLQAHIADQTLQIDLTTWLATFPTAFEASWHLIALTWQPTTDGLQTQLLFNGQASEGSGALPSDDFLLRSLRVGISRAEEETLAAYKAFEGSIRRIQIWRRVYTSDSLRDVLFQPTVTLATDQVMLLGVNEATGTLLKDQQGLARGLLSYGVFPDVDWRRSPTTVFHWQKEFAVISDTQLLSKNDTEDTDLTLEAWIKIPTHETGIYPILATRNPQEGATESQWAVLINVSDETEVDNKKGVVEVHILGQSVAATDRPLEKDAWNHVVVQYNSAENRTITIRVNNQLSHETVSLPSAYNVHRRFYIGAGHIQAGDPWPEYFFEGYIDDVRLWHTIRSNDALEANQTRRLRGDEPGLVAYWVSSNDHHRTVVSQASQRHRASIPRHVDVSVAHSQWHDLTDPILQASPLQATDDDAFPHLFKPQPVPTLDGYNDYIHLGTTYLSPDQGYTVGFWYSADDSADWEYITATYEQAGNNPSEAPPTSLYRNGDEVTQPEARDEVTSLLHLLWRDRPPYNHPEQVAPGRIAALSLWNGMRTADDIRRDIYRHRRGWEVNLRAHWPLDDFTGDGSSDDGTLLHDRAENLAPATLVAGLENAEEKWQPFPLPLDQAITEWEPLSPPLDNAATSLYFDGVDDHVVLPSPEAHPIVLSQGLTVEAWIRLEDPQVGQIRSVVGTDPMTAEDHPLCFGVQGDRPYLSMGDGFAWVSDAPLDNTWHHVVWQIRVHQLETDAAEISAHEPAASADPSATNADALNNQSVTLSIWVDGERQTSTIATIPAGPSTIESPVIGRCGRWDVDTEQPIRTAYFQGWMAEIRLWNTIRSRAELLQYGDRTIPGSPDTLKHLVAYWIFDSRVRTRFLSRVTQDENPYHIIMDSHYDLAKGLEQPTWGDGAIDDHPILNNPLPPRAIAFDGIRQYAAALVDLPTVPFTLEVWVKPAHLQHRQPVLRWSSPDGATLYLELAIEQNANGQDAKVTAILGGMTLQSTNRLDLENTFTHLSIRIREKNSEIIGDLSVNGSENDSDVVLWPHATPTSGLLQMGRSRTEFFAGSMTEMRLWTIAKEPQDRYHPASIDALSTSEASPLLGYWPLREIDVSEGEQRWLINQVTGHPTFRLGGLVTDRKPDSGEPTGFLDARRSVFTLPPAPDALSQLVEFNHLELSTPDDTPDHDHRAQRTIEVWFLSDNPQTDHWQMIYAEPEAGESDRQLGIYLQGGALYFVDGTWSDETGMWDGQVIMTRRIHRNHWHQAVLVLDAREERRDDAFCALLDGRMIDTRPSQQVIGHPTALGIGGMDVSGGTATRSENHQFIGQIARLYIWEGVLSPETIRDRYHAPSLTDAGTVAGTKLLLGWNTETLPSALTAAMRLPNPTANSAPSIALPLQDLAAVHDLQTTRQLPLTRLAALWSDLHHLGTGDSSTVFDDIFNPRGTPEGDRWFFSQVQVWEVQSDNRVHQSIRARLISSLRVSSTDLDAMVSAISGSGTQVGTVVLDGISLSHLYRVKLLAVVLRLSIRDTLRLVELLQHETTDRQIFGRSLNSLNALTIQDVVQLQQRAEWMRASTITVQEYDFLVNNRTSPQMALPYSTASVITMAAEVLDTVPEYLLTSGSFVSEEISLNETASDIVYRWLLQLPLGQETLKEREERIERLGGLIPPDMSYLGDAEADALLAAIAEQSNWRDAVASLPIPLDVLSAYAYELGEIDAADWLQSETSISDAMRSHLESLGVSLGTDATRNVQSWQLSDPTTGNEYQVERRGGSLKFYRTRQQLLNSGDSDTATEDNDERERVLLFDLPLSTENPGDITLVRNQLLLAQNQGAGDRLEIQAFVYTDDTVTLYALPVESLEGDVSQIPPFDNLIIQPHTWVIHDRTNQRQYGLAPSGDQLAVYAGWIDDLGRVLPPMTNASGDESSLGLSLTELRAAYNRFPGTQAATDTDLVGVRDRLEKRYRDQRQIPNAVLTTLRTRRLGLDDMILRAWAEQLDIDTDRLSTIMQHTTGKLYNRGILDVEAFLDAAYALDGTFATNESNVSDDAADNQASPIEHDLYRINKVIVLLAQFDLSDREISALLSTPDIFTLDPDDLSNPTFTDLDRLYTFTTLKEDLEEADDILLGVLQGQQSISRATGWNSADIQRLAHSFWQQGQQSLNDRMSWQEQQRIRVLNEAFPTSDSPLNTIPALAVLNQAFALITTLGTDAAYLIDLAQSGVPTTDVVNPYPYNRYERHASALLNLVRSQYDDDQWQRVYEPLHGKLSLQKRDSLTAIALENMAGKISGRKSPDLLYEYLLIDVQTSNEVQTSRIVQATASLQLYVQRCLMNLEVGVDPDTIPIDEWIWMKNYRVWEANRKVFLYPENYIEPELRDTKTPIFQTLEDDLQQSDVTKETATEAYRRYLDSFAEVTNLTIIGSYLNVKQLPQTPALSFKGRTELAMNTNGFPTNRFTLALWVSHDHLNDFGGILGHISTQRGFYVAVNRGRFEAVVVSHDNAGNQHRIQALTDLRDSQQSDRTKRTLPSRWHHLAVVYGSNKLVIYVDAEKAGEGNGTISSTIQYGDLKLGKVDYYGEDKSLIGEIRDLCLWDKELTQTQISEIFTQHSSHAYEPIRRWRMDEGSGFVAKNTLVADGDSPTHLQLDPLDSTALNYATWTMVPRLDGVRHEDSDAKTSLYLIGRNEATKEHYFRELEDGIRWHPWQKITPTINSNYVSPVFAFGRLFMFWAETPERVRSEARRYVRINDAGKPVDQIGEEIKLRQLKENESGYIPEGLTHRRFVKVSLSDTNRRRALDRMNREIKLRDPSGNSRLVAYYTQIGLMDSNDTTRNPQWDNTQGLSIDPETREVRDSNNRPINLENSDDVAKNFVARSIYDNTDGGRINENTDIVSDKLELVQQVNVPVRQPVIKYSYYNFSGGWTQPQTYSEDFRLLEELTAKQPKWQRIYAHRWRDSDVVPPTQKPLEILQARVSRLSDGLSWQKTLDPAIRMDHLTLTFWINVSDRTPAETSISVPAPANQIFNALTYGENKLRIFLESPWSEIGQRARIYWVVKRSYDAMSAIKDALKFVKEEIVDNDRIPTTEAIAPQKSEIDSIETDGEEEDKIRLAETAKDRLEGSNTEVRAANTLVDQITDCAAKVVDILDELASIYGRIEGNTKASEELTLHEAVILANFASVAATRALGAARESLQFINEPPLWTNDIQNDERSARDAARNAENEFFLLMPEGVSLDRILQEGVSLEIVLERLGIELENRDSVLGASNNAIRYAVDCLTKVEELLKEAERVQRNREKWERLAVNFKMVLGENTHTLRTFGYDKANKVWEYDKTWLHVSLILRHAGGTYTATRAIYSQRTRGFIPAKEEKDFSFSSSLLTAGDSLVLGADQNPTSDTSPLGSLQYQVDMGEVCLWDRILSEDDIEDNRFRKQEPDSDQHLTGLQVYLADGTGAILSDPELSLERRSPIEIPKDSRERIVILYGDQVRTLRNTLRDHTHTYTLKANSGSRSSHDLTLASPSNGAFVGLERANRMTPENYTANNQYTLDRFQPGDRVQILNERPSALSTTIQEWSNNEANERLLENLRSNPLDITESYLLDVHNQPGSVILDIGDEIFLVDIEIVDNEAALSQRGKGVAWRLKTAEERLKAEPQSQTTFEFTYTFDPLLEVDTPRKVRFRFTRLNTFVVNNLSEILLGEGIDGLLDLRSQYLNEPDFGNLASVDDRRIIAPKYRPLPDGSTGFDNRIDFKGAYGIYYEEIFFHIPFLIANQLNANQKFEEAQTWYHYIFNPTSQESAQESPVGMNHTSDRYWQYRPFRNLSLETLTELLTDETALDAYRKDPFDPHAIAQLRINTYQKAVVMKYIDNLLDWGDSLFRQDTRESINQAIQLYVLAFNLLGERPEARQNRQVKPVGSYDDILTDLRQVSIDTVPDFLMPTPWRPEPTPTTSVGFNPHHSVTTRFCVPENSQLLGYWDRVDDRLYKIRHSLNIDGVFRSLALFQPPIDPAALVRAVAGGGLAAGISNALAGVSGSVPHYRYSVMLDKAKEVTSYAMGLGASLLDALEKRDGEALTVLQHTHEQALLDMMTEVKALQIESAVVSREGLLKSKDTAQFTEKWYQERIDEYLSGEEIAQITLIKLALGLNLAASIIDTIKAFSSAVPQIKVGGSGVGGSPVATVEAGGEQVRESAAGASATLKTIASAMDGSANILGLWAGYKRRRAEWERERDLAIREQQQIDDQIEEADKQIDIAQRELASHQTTIQQQQEVADFYQSKFTNEALYTWMSRRLSGLYFQAYQIAYDLAKQAEKAYQFEFGATDTYISSGHWDSRRKGLLAGEALMLDLIRMEKSALDQDSRYMEVTKPISLLRINPLALLQLKETGRCQFNLGELLFDRDFPGHYFRIIKSVSISVPAVVGPYQTVKATLVQTGHKTLLEPDIGGVNYLLGNEPNMPSSIRADWRANQQIAISTGIEDSGVFQLDFNDDRYLPFEGTGAVSSWLLEMPKETNPINFDSITDVIIHLRYMCKTDTGQFKQSVMALDAFKNYQATRLLSLAHEFSTQWYAFKNAETVRTLELPLPSTVFPANVKVDPNIHEVAIATLYGTDSEGSLQDVTSAFRITITGETPNTFTLSLKAKNSFKKAAVENIIAVLTYSGEVIGS